MNYDKISMCIYVNILEGPKGHHKSGTGAVRHRVFGGCNPILGLFIPTELIQLKLLASLALLNSWTALIGLFSPFLAFLGPYSLTTKAIFRLLSATISAVVHLLLLLPISLLLHRISASFTAVCYY